MKRGFTIVELMMVVGIIAVLMGIVTTAASSSIKSSRSQRASAVCALVQAGLATYREQKGRWPAWSARPPTSRTNNEGPGGKNDPEKIVLTAKEVQDSVYQLVYEAKQGNPMMDISGLFVSRSPGERNTGAAFGLDFMSAVRGTKQSRKKMKSAEMYFGYPESEHGWFRRFKMVYSIPADTITVTKQDADSK